MQDGAQHIRTRLEEAATDIGRLRRRLTSDVDLWTLDRIGGHLESVYWMVTPTAAQLVAWNAPGDDACVVEAIRVVDDHSQRFQMRLGLAPR